jgi:hypothetical protein
LDAILRKTLKSQNFWEWCALEKHQHFCAIVGDEETHENSQVHYYKGKKFLHSRIMNIFAMPYYQN